MAKHHFQMPVPVKLTGRSSSLTNSFANAIIPVIAPTEAEIEEVLTILGMDKESVRCAYCGDVSTEWDHFRPLIKDKRPTGFISEIGNLVPACGKCNQSKGNKDWRVWINSEAQLSPKRRKVADLDARIRRLEAFERWRPVQSIDFAAMVDEETWTAYWKRWQELRDILNATQKLADEIRTTIGKAYAEQIRKGG